MFKENTNVYISYWLLLITFLVSLIIVVGGLTRLTDSGLSITEWQLFSGFLPPLSNEDWIKYFELYKKIPEFTEQNYLMTMHEFKVIFWWEWTHRFLGRLIGIFFLLPLLFFTFKLGIKKLSNLYIIFILICFQGFIGWYMVTSGLVDRVDVSHFRLSVHLIIAFFILSLILWNYLSLTVKQNTYIKLNYYIPLFFLFFIFCQIAIGAFVSGMDAGQIYNSWPMMGSSYFPDDNNFVNLFKFSAFSDPSLVQFMHRNLAYLILLFYILMLIKIYRKNLKSLFLPIKIVGFFLFIQILLGVLTLIYGAQIFLASMHQISSIFLVSSSVYLLYLNTNQLPSN